MSLRSKLSWALGVVAGCLVVVATLGTTRSAGSLIGPLIVVWLAATGIALGCIAGLLADVHQRWTVPLLVAMTVAGALLVAVGAVSIANASEVLSTQVTDSGAVLLIPVPVSGLVFGGIAVYGLIRPGPVEVAAARPPSPLGRRVIGILGAFGAVAVLWWAVLVFLAGADPTRLVALLLATASVLVGAAAVAQLDSAGRLSGPRRVVQVTAGVVLATLSVSVLLGAAGPLSPSTVVFWLGLATFVAGVVAVVLALRERMVR